MVKEYKLNFKYTIPDGMKVPDLEAMLNAMFQELVLKYPYYKDTWLEEKMLSANGEAMSHHEYFTKKIVNEANELERALTMNESKRKMANILNLTAMKLHRAVHG